MIKIEAYITYDKPLTKSEEDRIAESIRQILQPHIAMAACRNVQDAVRVNGELQEPEFIRSQFLNIRTKIDVIPVDQPITDIKADALRFGIDLTPKD